MFVGEFADCVGFRLPFTLSPSCMGFGLLLSGLVDGGVHFPLIWLPLVALIGISIGIGIGIGVCYPLLGAVVLVGLEPEHFGAAPGVNQCARQLGAALGIAATGAMLGPGLPPSMARFHHAWTLSAVFCLSAVVVARLLKKRAR